MVNFPTTFLNARETLTTAEKFLPILKSMPNSDSFITLVAQALENDSRELSAALSRDAKCEYTGKIDTQDSIFDTSFMTFRDFCGMMTKQPNEAISEPAKQIVSVIERIGTTIHKIGYMQQLAKTRALIDELNKEVYQTAIDACGARIWYDAMVEADKGLRDLFHERIDERAQKESPIIKSAKRKLRSHLVATYSYVKKLNQLDAETFGPFAARFEEVAKSIAPSARARKTIRAKQNEDGQDIQNDIDEMETDDQMLQTQQ